MEIDIKVILAIIFAAFIILNLYLGIRIVPQSEQFIVERLGRYQKTLLPGLRLIIPFVEKVSFRVRVWDQNIPEFALPVITKDNVEIELICTIFWKVQQPQLAMYRAENVSYQLETYGKSAVRSAIGKMELDDVTRSRDVLVKEVTETIQELTVDWGIEVSNFEIIGINLDENTRAAQQKQLTAERERRAVEIEADGQLYKVQREAEGVKATAEAKTFELNSIAMVINKHGADIGNYDLMTRQVKAIGELAASDASKSLVLPTNVTSALGGMQTIIDLLGQSKEK